MSKFFSGAARNSPFVLSLRPARVETFYLEAPLSQPRRNAFGVMNARPALIVRLIDQDGTEGWGECFCNWPVFGAAHRKRIIDDVLAPMITVSTFDHPTAIADFLVKRTRSICIQCNEPGPFEQTIAALDIAAWDLVARRNVLPLADLLNGKSVKHRVPVYASALSESNLEDTVPNCLRRGIKAFKLKVGFGKEADRSALKQLRAMVGSRSRIMVDANQAWSLEDAKVMIDSLAAFDLEWIEEPITAVADHIEWADLANSVSVSLAAGENLRGEKAFDELTKTKALAVLQPDVIKWGGISGCHSVARKVLEANLRFCPHYLGGGIGLLASAHLLASMATGDLLEFDVSENPWIEGLAGDVIEINDGFLSFDTHSGLGVTPNLEQLRPFLVTSR